MIDEDKDEYEHESECQDYADYGPEGYHPVVLGERFNQKYLVVQKLGWGHFSTVWLVHNELTNEYAAMKVQRSKESHSESALDELQILSEIRKHQNDPTWLEFLKELETKHPDLIKSNLCRPLLLLDNFPHYGIHGKHYCSVFEILGPNLLDVIQHYEFNEQRMPLWLVKKITFDTLLGLVYFHDYCNIIHTDLKPENIMIKLESHEQAQLVEQIKAYKVKPISMKYLKNIQTSKNSKNKKKKLKKKLKKAGEAGGNDIDEEESSSQPQQSNEVSSPVEASQSKENNEHTNLALKNSQPNGQQKIKQERQELISQKQNGKPELLEEVNKMEAKTEEKINEGWNPLIMKWKSVKIDLNYKIFFKIVDMGNACFSNKHFTEGIQTREYRSPEVILGHPYFHNTDMWSLGCTVFELMTNNFLFKPKKLEGISKDEDHLYKMLEILGPMPKDFATGGTESSQYFNKKGRLINGNPKEQLSISKLLIEDYGYDPVVGKETEDFLMQMLAYEPKNRISARECLKSEWLWK